MTANVEANHAGEEESQNIPVRSVQPRRYAPENKATAKAGNNLPKTKTTLQTNRSQEHLRQRVCGGKMGEFDQAG